MRFKMLLILLIAVSGFSNHVFAQVKEDDEVLRVDTQLVDIPVVITDKTGKPIFNLKQSSNRFCGDERAV